MESNPPFDVEQFIKEVKCRPVLWDSKHPNYNHRQAKTSAWEDVALNLYLDSENWSNYDKFGKVRDIQKRWKNMRDNYVKEIKYEKKVEQGLVAPKKKRYMYADMMDFLKPRKKPPSKCSSEKSSSEDNEEEMDAETNNRASDSFTLMDEGYSSSHVNQFCKVMYDSHPPQDYTADQHSQRNSPEPSSKASTDAHPQRGLQDPNSRRNFPIYQPPSDNTSVSQKNVQVTDPTSCRSVPSANSHLDSSSVPLDQDDDKMFLLSLAPYFKKFSEERKLQARINVSKMLHDMLYKQT